MITMTLSPVEIGADLAAGLLAASKLLSVAQPLWDKLPKWLAVAIPVLIVCLPQVASAAGLVQTSGDLLQVGITAVALLLPGIAQAEAQSLE